MICKVLSSTWWMGVAALIVTASCAVAADRPAKGTWVPISDGVLAKLKAKDIKPAWPGKTTGVAVDRTTGSLYMIVCGQGVWKSRDKGATFRRVDGKTVGGRCETGYSLCADPAGKRLVCFMLDGTSARTLDAGKTWTPVKNIARGYDWAAVDFSDPAAATVFALVHESGGIGAVSRDGGKTWKQIGKKYHAVGVIGPGVLLCGKEKQKGIFRSTDAGESWTKLHDATPAGVLTVFEGTGYWLTDQGLLATKDKGQTFRCVAVKPGATWGPYFGKDERHFVVVGPDGFHETADAGKTWKCIAPLPATLRKGLHRPGWFLNVAWDPIGKVCYAARMGQPTFKCEY